MNMSAHERLCKTIDYRFTNAELLQNALTHRSAAADHNERLEYLGDAILGFIVAEKLYQKFPELREGGLSRLRAHLVNRVSLANRALAISLDYYIRLGQGEINTGGQKRESILAGALEALIGAIYLDGGMDVCRKFTLEIFAEQISNLSAESDIRDPKSRLQEHLQSRKLALPEYRVIGEKGRGHELMFSVECHAENKTSIGVGRNRRGAEQAAAAQILGELEDL